MTGLRTKEGILFSDSRWKGLDDRTKNRIILSAKKWETSDNILLDENSMRLTDSGKLLADGIASDLFQL